jgi:hypothetical protein
VFFAIILLVVISIPFYGLIRVVQSFKKRRPQAEKENSIKIKVIDACYSMALFCLFMVGFYFNSMGVEAGKPLKVYQMGGAKAFDYASLSNEHILSVVVLLLLGMFSFWIISSSQGMISPIIFVLCSTLIILNILFAIIYLTHTGFSYEWSDFSVPVFQTSFVSLIFLYVARLKNSQNQFADTQKERDTPYRNRFLLFLYRTSVNYQKMPRLWAFCLFPVLILVQLLLVLFGQRPDSLIRVFLETSSFNYSRIPAPPPEVVEGDGHYLCTVSANGHSRLVKPLRAGIRRGERITVNRQLLIANAFENILEQYTPNIHKIIRSLYDKYGYPISRHIQTQCSADFVYLLMKPLEWIFLLVLYTVDHNPENRIHIQYSELRKSSTTKP